MKMMIRMIGEEKEVETAAATLFKINLYNLKIRRDTIGKGGLISSVMIQKEVIQRSVENMSDHQKKAMGIIITQGKERMTTM